MVKARETGALALGAVLALGLFVWARIDEPSTVRTTSASPAPAPAAAASDVARIDLSRLDAEAHPTDAGRRDVFDFGSSSSRGSESAPEVTSPSGPSPPPQTTAVEPTPTPVPSLNVRFIGAVEKDGAKVAVLMTEKKEILTGHAGDVVANRLRIVRIGLESVDVQDVTGGAQRRLPLRAN